MRSGTPFLSSTVVEWSEASIFYNYMMLDRVMTYVTENPRLWPSNVEKQIENPFLKKIGIGVSFRVDPRTRGETFWISVIVK
ncbi:MAG: hypothetical protein JXE07_02185 [Candidatus Aminicenantes bacterium]|nr:hypothetical protein [Candidatus Aminicenantes bacterium]